MLDASLLDRIRIVLARPSHPGNIGSAARAMKTMGLSRLVLVAPKTFPDPQAEVMASGAGDVLAQAQVCQSMAEALEGTIFATAITGRRRELGVEPFWAREAATELATIAAAGEVALVFGNETAGLSNEEVAFCQRWAMIPANPEYTSLNLAQAVQVLCYELRQSLVTAGPPPAVYGAGELARHEDVEALLNHLERAALVSGFLDPASPKRFMPRMRRLMARKGLEREEVNILRGLLAALMSKFPE